MSSVVIVDDQGVNRKVLASLAATLEPDVQVTAFGDPWQALSYVRVHTPDLLITDYQMPTMNGAELIRQFRSVPDCRDVPAVVVTAYEDTSFRATALDAGATEFILSRLLALRHAEMPAAATVGCGAQIDQFDMFNNLVENLSASLVGKIHELQRVSAELQSLLAISETPAILVDEDLRIRHFTPQISRIYALTDRAIGQSLDTLHCNLDYDELLHDVRQVVRSGQGVERYLASHVELAHYLLRIVPSRYEDRCVLGALITFSDVTTWYDPRAKRPAIH
jgi:CheY-like chemotaxis protein